ncbi:LSU ribosomal protein L6p (L9e) [Mycoplasmopsis meleagridis]|uniref:Large ribosomal subunit protein uL6 n=1 Tax=Mycoplasmopsis meleagridis ATCC 25294 TaxID=1264554 RepID=A0A0F5H1Q6_9BACT|nr:50S ribosomal protein L6 [Mycoplasmopsis meleagridis]KKB27060.1 LSU ribosomal protein L6p (L9e) [Mycoplasmopsis meleagridis ATCC 25294]KUH47228.1 50S ribosomal protein L6 [Mycoplasmopsis meleagridis]OAD18453.1 LSU ribosomal protein L6p (L9e) [Mycoplasmopsis meleagridis]VEU77365.1 50S ribosomal protein L6 [Mycoplasmopsis meleagridis]
MSRVGNRILNIPANVSVDLTKETNTLTVKGNLGQLVQTFSKLITIKIENNQIFTIRANEEKHTKQLHGTTNALISNMLIGTSKGFKKELVIKGVGYKATLKGNILEIAAGYSHLVNLDIPSDVKVEVPKPTEITISGINKEAVGQFAAIVRKVRKPNPYSGKGIAYQDEIIRRKEGKTAAK